MNPRMTDVVLPPTFEQTASFTPGPWFVSGVRFKMNGGEWLSVNRYDENKKKDENIACVGFDPRTGAGWDDAHLIAAARDLLEALTACQRALTMIVDPKAIKSSSAAHAYVQAVEAKSKARAAIAKAKGGAA